MTDQTPFTLTIFVADGDPDGLQLVERSNWNGKAVVFPRATYTDVRGREEFQQTGVYLLLGPDPETDRDMVYVGEGDSVRSRLDSHLANKDFWTRGVFFIAGPGHLNKAHVKYLEHRLIQIGLAAKRAKLENGNAPGTPHLSEADTASMDVFLDYMLGLLPVLGVQAFERSSPAAAGDVGAVLYCASGKADAKGRDTPQGFVMMAGSTASPDEVDSLSKYLPGIVKLRKQLLEDGVLAAQEEGWRFTQDYTFSSPSQASAVVLGRSSNGRRDWRDASGRTLNEIQESQTRD